MKLLKRIFSYFLIVWGLSFGLALSATASPFSDTLFEAHQGNRSSQMVVSKMYSSGVDGAPQNDFKAFEWALKAANQEYIAAQLFLSAAYYQAKGVEKDDAKAFEWALKAANQNDVEAQIITASMYDSGIGVQQDDAKAFEWYLKALNNGDIEAFNAINEMYDKGRITQQNYDKAYELKRRRTL